MAPVPESPGAIRGRMRCPAIEGIETIRLARYLDMRSRLVECVAPLLRGLKQAAEAVWERMTRLHVECVAPLLRGLKPRQHGHRLEFFHRSSNALPRY